MNMLLTRHRKGDKATMGDLAIDGIVPFCFTLEPGTADGKGPIPAGGYDVVIDQSVRFKRRMPHVLGVPGFDGIRIHSGNTDKDTSGCILVGFHTDGISTALNSRAAFDALFTKIDDALQSGEGVRLQIVEAA